MVFLVAACVPRSPNLVCRVEVPAEFLATATLSPNAESEAARYRAAYEAFWWRCVAARAHDLDAECAFLCSGTPAAGAGCRDGGEAAQAGIDRLLETLGGGKTREYLLSLSRRHEARKAGA